MARHRWHRIQPPVRPRSTRQTLVTAACAVTHNGLENAEGMAGLRALYLSGNRVSDDGLRHLKRLDRLEILDLAGTRVSNAGLTHLAGLGALEEIPAWVGTESPTSARAASSPWRSSACSTSPAPA